MTIDLTLAPLYRIDGQERPALPGLLVQMPPASAVRIRAHDKLAVYLLLLGNAVVSASEYMKLAQQAAGVFYKTGGSLTNALRAAADSLNQTLLERNISTSGAGQYANGWLTLAAVRDSQCTLSMSGPMHAYWFGRSEARHIHEPAAAGRGLGISRKASVYFAQVTLSAGDRMILYGRAPAAWESALNDARPSSLDAMRRRLSTITRDDLNAVLIQAADGPGSVRLLDGIAALTEEKTPEETPPLSSTPNLPLPPKPESTPEPFPAHALQPSAYAIPPQREETNALFHPPQKTAPREFPASIPRAKPKPKSEPMEEMETMQASAPDAQETAGADAAVSESLEQPEMPRQPSESARQAARTLAGGIRFVRQLGETLGEKLRNFLPRLLPSPDVTEAPTLPSAGLMAAVAALIPLVVVTVLVAAYLNLGRSQQYDLYLRQAIQMREQALTLNSPVEQRKAWENALANVARAEEHRQTPETASLRSEAERALDQLLGITRMQFNPAFSIKPGFEISRMAVSNGELYMLNAETGAVLRAFPAPGGRGFQMDTAFRCEPGAYGNMTVGPLVDILSLPPLNFVDASVLGIDANGNLLYCAPTRVPHPASLPAPDTNWNRVTAFDLDGEILYVLDAAARAAWVYNGKSGAFTDRPYFFFGQQTPTRDVIDFIVSGDEMYMLHSDGRVSTCSYSRITASASDCRDPLPFQNPFEAYGGADLFASANFTKILFAAPPNPSILLLDAEGQQVMKFSPRLLELQTLFRPTTGSGNPVPAGVIRAVAVSSDHVLYIAVNGQVYFALNLP